MDSDFDMAKEFADFRNRSEHAETYVNNQLTNAADPTQPRTDGEPVVPPTSEPQDQPMPSIEQASPVDPICRSVFNDPSRVSVFNPSRGGASTWQPAPLPEVAPQFELLRDPDHEAPVSQQVHDRTCKPERISHEIQFPEPQVPAPIIEQPVQQITEQLYEPSHLPGQPYRQRIPINTPRPAQNLPTITPLQRAIPPRRIEAAGRAVPSFSTAGPSSSKNTENIAVTGGTPGVRLRRNISEGLWIPDDPAQVEAVMNDGQQDHSWMEDDGNYVDEEYEAMSRLRNLLQRKATSGKMNERERLELYKVQKKIFVKDRLRKAASGVNFEADEDELFVNENSHEEPVGRHREVPARRRVDTPSPNGDDDDDAGELPPSSFNEEAAFSRMLEQVLNGKGVDTVPTGKKLASKPKKVRKKPAMNARERVQREREIETEKQRKKAQKKRTRQQASPIPTGKKEAAGKGKTGKTATSKKKGKTTSIRNDHHAQFSRGRRNGEDAVGQMILDDLMNHDPINDRLNNPIFNVDPEPEMHGRIPNATQLQKLFANIPEESNKKSAQDDKRDLARASKSFGFAKVKAVDGKWLVKGMKSTLYHHQLLGAQWMLQRELSPEAPFGGLLADGMGLGKTVQTLACMVGNPPQKSDIDRKTKATLIVVPSAVIDQWMDEIRTHAEEKIFPKMIHYKTSKKIPMCVLQDLDIVLTSYTEVMNQFPFPDQMSRKMIAQMGYKKWWKLASLELGDLHKVNWYRVVLDEAHAIKNNAARTSLACQNLKSLFRWCLTGTPLLNRLEELFPYLRFLKADYSMDWKTFQQHFCDPEADDCHARIATLLSYTMMRRTMATTIMNRPIITLPKPHPQIQYVDFSTEERIIYRITENRFRSNLNAYFADKNDPRHSYGMFLVQLLRLRQCTSHPFMLERTIKEAWTSEDLRELRVRLSRLKKNNTPFYEQCKLWVDNSEAERQAAQAARDRGEEAPDETLKALPFGKSDFGHKFRMDKALATLSEKELYKRVVCSICSDIPMNPTTTDCGHIFCKDCLSNYMHERTAEFEEAIFICPSCDRMFQSATPYKGLHIGDEDGCSQPDEDSPGPAGRHGPSKKNKGSKGKDVMGFEPTTQFSTWVKKSDHDPYFPLAPSTKTTALKAILLKGFEEAPLDKVVIYVQFRLLACIVGRICEKEGWGFLYLTGDSNMEHRSKVVKNFRQNPNIKILIAGLKCGGIGLNFPWANRCISLDLWWNHAVEQQAFGRIFRIGQTKETHMTRIVVRNTVDMRLLSMQMYKLQTCERAMQDGEKKDKAALDLHDLARLFGFLRTDEDGLIVSIEPDYGDADQDDDIGGGEGNGWNDSGGFGGGAYDSAMDIRTGYDGVGDGIMGGMGDLDDLGDLEEL